MEKTKNNVLAGAWQSHNIHYHDHLLHYPVLHLEDPVSGNKVIGNPIGIWITAIFRIFGYLMPQNQWTTGQENRKISLLRNIPFAVTGICIILLFTISGNSHGYGLGKVSIAVAGSFVFYLPVTLYASKKPAIGALMLPKTVMYIWIICMGLKLRQIFMNAALRKPRMLNNQLAG